MTTTSPGWTRSMSRPKKGTPVLRTWKRGSDFAVREMITYALPVTGPGCAVSGKTISNLVSRARADGRKSKEYTMAFPQSRPAHRLFLELDILHLSIDGTGSRTCLSNGEGYLISCWNELLQRPWRCSFKSCPGKILCLRNNDKTLASPRLEPKSQHIPVIQLNKKHNETQRQKRVKKPPHEAPASVFPDDRGVDQRPENEDRRNERKPK